MIRLKDGNALGAGEIFSSIASRAVRLGFLVPTVHFRCCNEACKVVDCV